MANNVDNYVALHNANDEAKALWHSLFSKEGLENVADVFPDTPDDYDRGWAIDHVGAKWAYFEDNDYENQTFMAVSAWGIIGEFAEWLSEQIYKVDQEAYITLEGTDEMPNWFGVWVYQDGLYDYVEFEHDELQELIFEKYPETKEAWNEEESEWDWESDAYDKYNDVFWEELRDLTDAAMKDITGTLE
jgi:hypothetical protein